MEAAAAHVKVVGPKGGKEGFLGSIGVRFMIDGIEAGERFSLVEHPMSPRALAAPLHLHTREDEYSFVLQGRMGALLGDDVVEAGPGDLVSSHATSGTRSGTRATSLAGSSRSSRQPASSASSGSSSTWAAWPGRTRRRSHSSGNATAWRCSPRPSPNCSSASGCGWASLSPAAGRRDLVGLTPPWQQVHPGGVNREPPPPCAHTPRPGSSLAREHRKSFESTCVSSSRSSGAGGWAPHSQPVGGG